MVLKFRTLKAEEIDCRVNQIEKDWCSLLLYKDARCDMNILDETIGPNNWERHHKELKGNIYCGVAIYDKDKEMFIEKYDAGKESNTESEKGEASDSFKRACVNWGIGRELYSSPTIYINALTDKEFYKNEKGKYTTKTKFYVASISYDENRNIKELVIKDKKGNVRFKQVEDKATKEQITLIQKLLNKEQIESACNLVKRKNLESFTKQEADSLIKNISSKK